MEIKPIEDMSLVRDWFLNDPKLAILSLPDSSLHELSQGKFEKNSNEVIVGFYTDRLIAVLQYESFTECTANYHIYLNSYHEKNTLSEITELGHEYLKQLGYKKAIFFTPSCCTHVHKASEKHGYVLSGTITNSQIWRGQLVDMLIYSRDL